jgi:hypothetical protein
LKTPASPLNQYIAQQLSAETKQLLKDYDGSDQMPVGLRKSLVAALSKDLNRLLFDERLFDKKRFASTSLDDETERLIGRLLEGKLLREELGRLNRRLLEQAYRNELAEYFRLYRVGEGQAITSIEKAVELWRGDLPRTAIIEITDNGVYSEPLEIRLDRGQSLQIRAADRKRPIIYLHELRKNRPEWLTVTSRTGGCFVLEGLLLTGRSMLIEGAVEQVRIRHCTLVPGWGIGPDCDPKRPGKPSIELKRTDCHLMIEQSIVGSIQVNKDEVRSDPLEIRITDSVVDATSDEREAVGAASWPRAHAALRVERSTVIGQVQANAIALAEDSIFTGLISVTRRQTGCMRFCYVPPGSRTPRRYNCQPDMVEALVAREFDRPEQADERKQALEGERVRVRPQFNSTRYGRPDYCQLAETCAVEITRGSSDNSEMGVFHNLFQPQRGASLRARLLEFLPAGAEAGIIFVS